jgi:DNA helicase HerA-like ATPase
MSQSPIEQSSALTIGVVDFVSPDEIKVALEIEAPSTVALNAGAPRPFPRVNSYLLVAVDDAFIVGQIGWLTIERSPFPKRRGMQDFGLIDLPYPLRRLSLNPLGTLRRDRDSNKYEFRRGADFLPSIGAAVLLPSESQLRSIVESGARRRIRIGTSPLAADAEVRVDPDRLFGRHLAVIGNTGSGKSCTVAGLIRWSLEQAQAMSGKTPNARFIVLDPNGEYGRAFAGSSDLGARIFRVDPGQTEHLLKVPIWFWNSAEWCSFTQASARTQRPLLRRALREVKGGATATPESSESTKRFQLRRYLSSRLISIQRDVNSGAIQTEATKFGQRLVAIESDLETKEAQLPDCNLGAARKAVKHALSLAHKSFVDKTTKEVIEYYRSFSEAEIAPVISTLESSLKSLGGLLYQQGPDEDVPIPFEGTDLADHLEMLAEQENVTQYTDFLVARLRTFLSDQRMQAIVGDSADVGLAGWLDDIVGANAAEKGCVRVIDLSLIPSDVVHVVAAVIARMIFEALQRYLKRNNTALPTVLVMEEAHTFVRRYKEDVENPDAAAVCCQVFERIAREGRKFGLGMVLSSQRPSELSPTVLSQCNTFMMHRVSNDRDQELLHRLVPDNLKGLLRELPTLPSQSAILLGWASELPVLVKIDDLPKSQQPRSDDPDFWATWTGVDHAGQALIKDIDWEAIAGDWQAGFGAKP